MTPEIVNANERLASLRSYLNTIEQSKAACEREILRIEQELSQLYLAEGRLPEPDESGHYRLPDGCRIYPAADGCLNGSAIPGLGQRAGDADSPRFKGKWRATWKNGVPLRGDDQGGESISEFSSPEEAYRCILSGGEGR